MTTSYDPRTFTGSVEWRFAKTMAHYNPHWYVVERDHRGEAFDAFVTFVRSGPIRRYKRGRYHCVTVDEWDYFLTHAGADGWIVNRKPSAEAGWDPFPPTRDPRELILHDRERDLITDERAEGLQPLQELAFAMSRGRMSWRVTPDAGTGLTLPTRLA